MLLRTTRRFYAKQPHLFNITIVDLETTSLYPDNGHIIELAAIKVVDDIIVGTYCSLAGPKNVTLSEETTKITGITQKMIDKAPLPEHVVSQFAAFAGAETSLVAHNSSFDGMQTIYNLMCTRKIFASLFQRGQHAHAAMFTRI